MTCTHPARFIRQDNRGWRVCLICAAEAARRYRARKKEKNA